ncbi:uncharacterized protein FOMMEDRAFT_171285 [Fomitiporia mediterranea MF3/22]|uniref:uncharacterized protein n=1 Tax=Fomitiporia mediterranea (strain MF3/22) TaxID=694068 RepID=UPI000440891F|nr:uncharacterized protein FOMMEDRAFT_171285 [Fomitiporia mediterranea MF3/22]EJC97875.1 hypothetical protein FOMMEDRAFT_171285 [Fomitiporia mediterranea MF3/22]
MDQSVSLALLRKLLDVCKRWANRAFPLLLKLFSVIGRYLGLRQFGSEVNCTKKNDVGLTGIGDGQTSEHNNGGSAKGVSFSTPNDRAVIVACSSVPSMPVIPPPARTHNHFRSIDTSASFPRPRSPTLCNAPGILSENDEEAYCLSPLEAIEEKSFREGSIADGRLFAEPGGYTASPTESQSKPLKTIAPSLRSRYDRNIAINSKEGPWVFGPLATFNVYKNRDVSRWKHYVHPEGPPYYLLGKCGGRIFSHLTEADLQNSAVLEEVEAFVCAVERHATNFNWGRDIPENIEVVLEIENDAWSYYMVDLEQRCVFWLHDYDMTDALGESFGVESLDHFRKSVFPSSKDKLHNHRLRSGHQLDFEFWQHIEYFPNHRKLYPDIFNEVMGILNYWRIDVKSSADSAAPYDADDLNTLVVSVKHLRTVYDSGDCAYAIASVARIMGLTCNERQLNFYGFNGARISVWQSVRGSNPKKRSILINSLSPLLFYAPDTHLSGLEKLWVDGVIRDRRWKKYQYKLERDWESFVLTSTVLLNANVALLSSPIIYSNGDTGLWASPAAVASQVSIVASIASIVIGLLLVRQIRISSKDIEITASDTIRYLSNRKHEQLGLETIAIQYSLPYALLMWGVITFLTSIAIACFFRVNGTPDIVEQMIYAVSWFFAIPLILWTVLTGWETNNQAHWTELLSASWWKSAIYKHWKGNLSWPRRTAQKSEDIEADQETTTEEETAADCGPEQAEGLGGPKVPGHRNWRIRVKNFGPVRRLTFNSFMRS